MTASLLPGRSPIVLFIKGTLVLLMKKTIAATAAVICMAFTAAAQSPAETEVLKGWLRYANAPNAAAVAAASAAGT